MTKSALLATLILGQAATLTVTGFATIWWSQDLMTWLIYLVGEERALGAGNVIHVNGGGKLLTNPAAMFRWTIPFWAFGALQITSALTLVALWVRLSTRFNGPVHESLRRVAGVSGTGC
jgi:hypothetical protein